MKDFHKQMTKKLGAMENVDKTIHEVGELIEKLRDWKVFCFLGATDSPDFRKCMESIQEERVDVSIMLKRLDYVLNFTNQENKNIATKKINRTIERYLLK